MQGELSQNVLVLGGEKMLIIKQTHLAKLHGSSNDFHSS